MDWLFIDPRRDDIMTMDGGQETDVSAAIAAAQRQEMTEHLVYSRLAERIADPHNKEVLARIAGEELRHYQAFRQHTRRDIDPDRIKVWTFLLLARIFGITFAIRRLERGETQAIDNYSAMAQQIPDIQAIIEDETRHENELIDLIDEERLKYVGAVVLGMNDALVELTGTLAGLSFAFQNTRVIAIAGIVTGVAASLSMAASEYLSASSEGHLASPLRAAGYTGATYILTVIMLVAPYLIFAEYLSALALTITNAVLIILVFTYYLSVAREIPFGRQFLVTVSISLGVAAASFLIGLAIRAALGIDV